MRETLRQDWEEMARQGGVLRLPAREQHLSLVSYHAGANFVLDRVMEEIEDETRNPDESWAVLERLRAECLRFLETFVQDISPSEGDESFAAGCDLLDDLRDQEAHS